MWCRRWSGVIEAHLAALGLAALGGLGGMVSDAPRSGTTAASRSTTLPYGVAIAAGGIAIVIEFAKL